MSMTADKRVAEGMARRKRAAISAACEIAAPAVRLRRELELEGSRALERLVRQAAVDPKVRCNVLVLGCACRLSSQQLQRGDAAKLLRAAGLDPAAHKTSLRHAEEEPCGQAARARRER